jgi:predicted RNase H-like HicB family nuclease
VWANADTEEARAELAEVIEEWVLLSISRGLPVPDIAGVRAPI